MLEVIGWLISAILSLGASHAAPTPQIAPIQTGTIPKVEVVTIPIVKTIEIPVVPQPTVKVTVPEVKIPAVLPTPEPGSTPISRCNSNYSGCLRSNAGDYDCAGGSGNGPNYTGAVRVIGYDEFGLDRDNDGWGCE